MEKTVYLDCETRSGIPIEVTIVSKKQAECKGCGAAIRWSKTQKGKWMPIEIESGGMDDLYIPHWDRCPASKRFKNK